MRGAMLFGAGLFVGLAIEVGMAQITNSGVVMMNHVGINVSNIPEAVTYYTQKMGYREAFRVNDQKGSHVWSTCRSARTHFSNSNRQPRSGLPVLLITGCRSRTRHRLLPSSGRTV
jgi:hypothetical protein